MAAKSIKIAEDGRVQASVDVVADYLGLTPRRVQQLEKSRGNLRYARGLYDLQGFVRSYCDQLRADDSVARGEGWEAKVRLDKANAALKELDLAEREGELISAEGVRKQDFTLSRILRNNLLSMADRISALVAAESDAKQCHKMITTEVENSLLGVIANMESAQIDEADLDITRKASKEVFDEIVSQETLAGDTDAD